MTQNKMEEEALRDYLKMDEKSSIPMSDSVTLISIAVSLKRIADALSGTKDHRGINDAIFDLEHLIWQSLHSK